MIPTRPDDVFTPKVWVLGHPGTNGYITSWGMMLSGTAPPFPPEIHSGPHPEQSRLITAASAHDH